MMKMEIKLDRFKLERLAYNWNKVYKTICESFEKLGCVKEHSFDETTIIYRGTNPSKDYSNFGFMVNLLVKQIWFKESVVSWYLYHDGIKEDCIEAAKRKCKEYGW